MKSHLPRLHLSWLPETVVARADVPAVVREYLGAKATEYARALSALAQAGNKEASVALKLLQQHASQSPVYWKTDAKWKMDALGLVSLQLLLWIWQAQHKPERYGGFGIAALTLAPFSRQTAHRWWRLARDTLLHFYRHPEQVPQLRNLVTAQSCRDSDVTARTHIIRKLRERFLSFAP
jgi:hypothetical protein